MADKTTTLKTKTNDNVYPNVIGDNRKNAFVDSSTITHHFYDQTHKVGFQINNETNIKIQNSLQKPAGLTKTKLVGVGTNGQENIEIGDNLTLANGKLSATGGGGGKVGIVKLDETQFNAFYSGEVFSLTDEQYNIIKTNDTIIFSYTMLDEGQDCTVTYSLTKNVLTESSGGDSVISYTLLYIISNAIICLFINTDKKVNQFGINAQTGEPQEQIYSHFITLISPTLGNINFNYYTTKEQKFTIETLTLYFSGKRVTCSGFINYSGTRKIAQYIDGVNDKLMVWFYDLSDGSINSIIIDNTFSITDRPVPVY